ncbi:hypothetical protein K2173_006442 [Erythroxylum novogranatense]|uniref:CRM domain-containing protein n=1 Tax=Erythroxylum novogranatense TaxID=1862640 RepID=A0AAV8TED4_9ROSI|nr:hypothetical protein K2173_006442 [Erythroxylum novogranatense]
MALVPSRQLHLESSFSKFHGTPLQFFRYTCSFPPKPHTLCSNSPAEKRPTGKSPLVSSGKPISQNAELSTSRSWLAEWHKPSKRIQLKSPQAVFNYRNRSGNNIDSSGTGSTMEKIVEKLKRNGFMGGDGSEKKDKEQERVIEKGSVEDIFYVEEGMLPNSRGGFSMESPLGVDDVFRSDGEVRFPWEKPKKVANEGEGEKWSARSKSRTHLAELTLPPSELRRLRQLTYQEKSRVRVKGRGVTQEVVDAIHQKWKMAEIVRVKVEGPPALNMKRVHEILERKTGGLVIWRSGSSVSLYRGVSYDVPSAQSNKRISKRNETSMNSLPTPTAKTIRGPSLLEVHESHVDEKTAVEAKEKRETSLISERKYEDEVDNLLDGLGPRYKEWPGCDPLPVDADLLPGIVPGYQPPFRILPYGVRANLGSKEATALRWLARALPPHFALGRSRQLQGLAAAMIKLWEKSSIAKVALKRGVQLTTSERMAEDIKKLTGCILLSRNKDFLVFYRGKDFLAPEVAEALLERERLAKSLQDEEEQARSRASALVTPTAEMMEQAGTAGTLEETLDANARWGKKLDEIHKEELTKEAEIARHSNLMRKLEKKLAFAERRLVKAEQALSKVEGFLQPAERQADPESITDEERYMFRKLGLKMKAFLLLGRRGVFGGTVENMHLHWKYRELVKIILKAKSFEQVKKIALALEAESGGVLVSVDKVSKGYAIIVYRGKDYQRPSTLRPKNLLTKRKALARSIEIQRREALLNHVSTLQNKVENLRSEIEQMTGVKDTGDEELYNMLDSAYPTDEDDSEDEQYEAYLETYTNGNPNHDENDDNGTGNTVQNVQLESNFPCSFQDQESETETELEDEDEAYDDENESAVHNFQRGMKYPFHLQDQESEIETKEDGSEADITTNDGEDYLASGNLVQRDQSNFPYCTQNHESGRSKDC